MLHFWSPVTFMVPWKCSVTRGGKHVFHVLPGLQAAVLLPGISATEVNFTGFLLSSVRECVPGDGLLPIPYERETLEWSARLHLEPRICFHWSLPSVNFNELAAICDFSETLCSNRAPPPPLGLRGSMVLLQYVHSVGWEALAGCSPALSNCSPRSGACWR